MSWKEHLCARRFDREYNSARTGLARAARARIFELRRLADTRLRKRRHSAGDVLRVRRRLRNLLRRPRGQISGSGWPGHATPLTYGRDVFLKFEEKSPRDKPSLSRGADGRGGAEVS